MGLITDGIIGPLLETFGVITIDETGEWKKPEKPQGNYNKKEKPQREGFIARIKKWLSEDHSISGKIKELLQKQKEEKIESWREETKKVENWREEVKKKDNAFIDALTGEINIGNKRDKKKELRRISKMEGKLLLGTGTYRVWYGDTFPYDDEIMENVVYIVKGAGDRVFSSYSPLSDIREDGYYVWNETKPVSPSVNIEQLKKENKELAEKITNITKDLKKYSNKFSVLED